MPGSNGGSRANTLPRSARIRKRPDFQALRRRGQRFRSAHFLMVRDANPAFPTRLGVTVTRKIGNAVARNRIKRGVREAFRHARSGLPAHTTWLLIAQRGAGELSAGAVAAEVGEALREHAGGGR